MRREDCWKAFRALAREVIEGVVFEVKGEDLGALWNARLAAVAGEVALGSCLIAEVMANGLRRTNAIAAEASVVLRTEMVLGEKQSDVEEGGMIKAEAVPRADELGIALPWQIPICDSAHTRVQPKQVVNMVKLQRCYMSSDDDKR